VRFAFLLARIIASVVLATLTFEEFGLPTVGIVAAILLAANLALIHWRRIHT
jgi:4-amino-4-deoxy-L-arabinose transferase-like glycosyltransferase